ncbi:MAG: YciI family protein [Solirubrobacteraceae bacterium]
MDFLIYSRAAPAAANADDDPQLDERHWSYMDRFADRMTARGPLLETDRQTWAGSVHIVDLPTGQAVREFVAHEPYNQAAGYEQHLIWRFVNVLGQTMWQFARAPNEPRFLVLVLAHAPEHASAKPTRRAAVADLPSRLRERLIVYGELRNLDDDRPVGVALALQAPTRAAADALLKDRRAGIADYRELAIHDWQFGGRR